MKPKPTFFLGLALGYAAIHILKYVSASYLWILFYRP